MALCEKILALKPGFEKIQEEEISKKVGAPTTTTTRISMLRAAIIENPLIFTEDDIDHQIRRGMISTKPLRPEQARHEAYMKECLTR